MSKRKELDPNAIHAYLLQALRDISYVTNRGMIDKGSPSRYLKLSVLGYVKKVQDGYQITQAGRDYLTANKKALLKL